MAAAKPKSKSVVKREEVQKKTKVEKSAEVEAPAVDGAPVPTEAPVTKEKPKKIVEVQGDETGRKIEGPEITMPTDCTIVYGGPIIKGVRCPFGFSVLTDRDPVKGNEKNYGARKGVTAHSVQGGLTTYMIEY